MTLKEARFGLAGTLKAWAAIGRAEEAMRLAHRLRHESVVANEELVGRRGRVVEQVFRRLRHQRAIAEHHELLGLELDRPRRLVPQSDYPAVERDLNLVVDRVVPWGDLERAIRAADTHDRAIESIRLVQVWEDAERLGPGKKSMVVGLRLRSASGTISSDESRRIVEGIVATCGRECGAVLRG